MKKDSFPLLDKNRERLKEILEYFKEKEKDKPLPAVPKPH